MEPPLPAIPSRRRSDRVSIAFPVEVAGIDLAGKRFSEKTKTTTVSRYGCCLPLPRPLGADQKVQLRRIGTNDGAVGRVIVPMGSPGEGRLYGVETEDSCEDLWGIRFTSSLYEKLLDNIKDGVYFVNRERKITYWNEGAERLVGYSASEVVGQSCVEHLGQLDGVGSPLCLTGCSLGHVMLDGQPRQIEIYLRHKQGHRIPVSVQVLPMLNNLGTVVGAVEIFTDATARIKVEKRVSELEHLAFRDVLTGLPNRRYLEMKVDQALQEHRGFDRRYGLLMFDLDQFKKVNDTYGHDVGDSLLKAVAHTLVQGQRIGDMVGRWGGEEFVILMPDVDAVSLGDLAERCRVLIAKSSVGARKTQVSVTASIGATMLSHTDTAKAAIRRADELMYQSKRSGGDQTTAG